MNLKILRVRLILESKLFVSIFCTLEGNKLINSSSSITIAHHFLTLNNCRTVLPTEKNDTRSEGHGRSFRILFDIATPFA